MPATLTRPHDPTPPAPPATPQRSWAAQLISGVPGSASGLVEALRAASADVTGALDPRHHAAVDPLELRDPEYIRRTLPGLRALSDLYFRAEVRGIDNVPAGPVLLVGNHSGGWLIADTFVFGQSFYDRFGPERAVLPARPRPRVQGSRSARDRHAVRRRAGVPGEHAPGARPRRRRARVSRRRPRDLPSDAGIPPTSTSATGPASSGSRWSSDVPIVPVVAIGGQETALFLGQGEHLARLLHLHELLRLDVAPVQIAPPLGRHRPRPPRSACRSREDHHRRPPADRPARRARTRRRRRARLRPRHRTHAAGAGPPGRRAQVPADRLTHARRGDIVRLRGDGRLACHQDRPRVC